MLVNPILLFSTYNIEKTILIGGIMNSYNNLISNLNNNIRSSNVQQRSECFTIGRRAPDFIALSTFGYIRLSDYNGKWIILASHPIAFSSVSTTEIIDMAQNYQEFIKRNCQVIGLTTDNNSSNLAWVYDIFQKTGITIPFPIIGDADLKISALYGMLNADTMYGETVRDTFIINPFGKINAILTLPPSTGRNTNELLRVLDSMQITEKYNLHTPANWNHNNPLVVPFPNTYEEIIQRENNQQSLGIYCPFWYLCYTTLPEEAVEGPS